jgi:hypothetical protein
MENAKNPVSEWLLLNVKWAIFQLYHDENKVTFNDDNDVRFVLDQHAYLDLYSAGSLKQQSDSSHVAPILHIIPMPSRPVFAPTPESCMLRGETANTNLIVFGWARTQDLPHSRQAD